MSSQATVRPETLWASVMHVVRDELLPALPPGHERDAAVQLIGLAQWAQGHEARTAADHVRALASALGRSSFGAEPKDLLDEASRLLVEAVEQGASPRATAVRSVLCETLEHDFAAAEPLLAGFAGHRAADVDQVPREIPMAERRVLEEWIGDRLGGRAQVTTASVIPGGHSRRMLRLRVRSAAGERDLVARVEQHGLFATDGTREAGVLAGLAERGVPVPGVLGVESSDSVLGQPFFVMDFVRGSAEVTGHALERYLRELRAVHQLDPSAAAAALGPVPATAESAIQRQLDHWLSVYRASSPAPIPLLEEAAAWLRCTLRPTADPVLVHGDPGPGNFLHADGRIVALTDWEFAHYGDPCEDWAYLAAIRGRKVMSRVEWQATIRRATGVEYDAETWRAWETFNLFKGSCVNLTALRLFCDGTSAAPNLLAIGTAVHLRFLRQLALVTGADPARAA